MGSLRELLDKQKREKEIKANAAIKPVLQSQSKQAEKEISPQAKGTKGDISSESLKTSRSTTEILAGNIEPAVVEQRPPAGLSGIALIKWKREHQNGKAVPEKSKPTTAPVMVEKTPEKIIEQATPQSSQSVKPVTTNDGVIDTSELRRNLEYLANNIEQKELVGQIVRTIAKQLKDSPELCSFMLEADVDLMVRALRRSYSVVARKKSETKEAKEKGKKGSAELDRAFKDAGLGDLDIFK